MDSPTITVWHNNVGRPVPCAGLPNGYEGRSGASGMLDVPAEWIHSVERFGHAITTVGSRPVNHYVIGAGVGHSDVDWCESRYLQGSMAAYYENGPAWGPREIGAVLEMRRSERRAS